MRIHLATSNPGKVADFGGVAGLEWALLPGFAALPGIAETGATFEANARLKAEHYSRLAPDWIAADDSGLEVAALGGAPGVHSARFAGRHGDDGANNRLLLERLQGVPPQRRGARYVCVLALAQAGRVAACFCGAAEGRILEAGRGSGGFGYDPLFFSPAANATFAEISLEHKAALSHRGAAARALLAWLQRQP
ncbi:MAG: non-canonical purine NTP pyrophosphatase [Terriglobales bacterium]